MQIAHWQQVARAVQDERARVARGLMDQVRQTLAGFSTRFHGLRAENKKLRAYIDHQKQLHESVARELQGQLQYALARIDELARERAEWRNELGVSRQAAVKYQQQVQEQRGVINSQQAALSELRGQLESAQGFLEVEERLKGDLAHLEEALEQAQTQLHAQDQTLAARDRELRRVQESYDAFKLRANEEAAALNQALTQAKSEAAGEDERVEEMTKLLANSEREVVKLHQELTNEREVRKSLEIQLEAAKKELVSSKRKATRLEKAAESAKGKTINTLEKQLEELTKLNERLQEELADKTHYMQAVEGQKGKLRPLPPAAEQGQ